MHLVDADESMPRARSARADPVHAKALGGSDSADNLRVRCRAHNHFHAEQVFGRAHVENQIQLRRRKSRAEGPTPSATAASPLFETAEKALRLLGFREPEVRRALDTLETKLDAETSLETIIRESLRLLT